MSATIDKNPIASLKPLESSLPKDLESNEKRIDDEDILQWSSSDEEQDDSEMDELWDEHNRVDDEDWEIAERDFTKQYNRLKQHIAVRSGTASGTPSSHVQNTAVVPLPAFNTKNQSTSQQTPSTYKSTSKPSHTEKDKDSQLLSLISKYNSRISNISTPYQLGYGLGGVGANNKKGPSEKANLKDKSDRATNEQVLDPRTRIILFKMIGRGLLFEINGCVSTGKEANVYHAVSPTSQHLALKIYKTSILIFKDRDRYVSGEHRFRHGYSRRNPRKMVRLWAEKEMRNLKRLVAEGIRAPEPVEVRENVLVMGFLGDDEGWASPRLKDADVPQTEVENLYIELLLIVRKMYHSCKLVHADLSEYNILYHASHLYIIDVSQSVEHDHPSSFDFLRNDLKNVDEFWSRRGVKTLGLRASFDFVVRDDLAGGGVEGEAVVKEETVLRDLIKNRIDGPEPDQPSTSQPTDQNSNTVNSASTAPTKTNETAAQSHQEDQIFLKSYIPRSLNEVYDPERDIEIGEKKDVYQGFIRGPGQTEEGDERGEVRFDGAVGGEGSESDEDEEDDSDEEGEDGEGREDRKPRGHRHEDKDAKKERKKAVKEEAREKRKNKIPKAEKKRKVKVTSHSK